MLWAFKGIVKHEGDEDDDAAGDTDVCDVEYREVDKVKADKVNHVTRDETINRVADATRNNNAYCEKLNKGWLVAKIILAFVIHERKRKRQ